MQAACAAGRAIWACDMQAALVRGAAQQWQSMASRQTGFVRNRQGWLSSCFEMAVEGTGTPPKQCDTTIRTGRHRVTPSMGASRESACAAALGVAAAAAFARSRPGHQLRYRPHRHRRRRRVRRTRRGGARVPSRAPRRTTCSRQPARGGGGVVRAASWPKSAAATARAGSPVGHRRPKWRWAEWHCPPVSRDYSPAGRRRRTPLVSRDYSLVGRRQRTPPISRDCRGRSSFARQSAQRGSVTAGTRRIRSPEEASLGA